MKDSDKFTGKESGMSFERFDEMVISWGRRKFGDRYAKQLWKNELVDIANLDLSDDLQKFEFDSHCQLVYDVLCQDSPKYADSLFHSERFSTKKMACGQQNETKGEDVLFLGGDHSRGSSQAAQKTRSVRDGYHA